MNDKTKRTTIRFTEALHQELKIESVKSGQPMEDIVAQAVKAELNRRAAKR